MTILPLFVRAVVIASIVHGAHTSLSVAIHQRSRRYNELATYHVTQRKSLLISDLEVFIAYSDPQLPPDISVDRATRILNEHQRILQDMEQVTTFMKYHYDMAEKYEFAADHPWLPVLPDPPQPAIPSKAYQQMLRVRYFNAGSYFGSSD